ncbi:sensor histidine kinase [Gaoshiqia sp. Z1-71]|uniref:sensor histidine kinase n=1 Tax=Gaoshiqia hydrogeniformans TaxID=3290090 RepID=UPI003BF88229
MNKRTFTLIMGLMGLSIIGIIVIQLVWINNAIRVKNELFDRSVNDALVNTARRLENRQDIRHISRFAVPDSLVWIGHAGPPPPPPKSVRIIRDTGAPGNTRFEIKTDSDQQVQVFTFNSDNGKEGHSESFVFAGKDTIFTNSRAIFKLNQARLDSLQKAADSFGFQFPGARQRFDLKTQRLRQFTRQFVAEIAALDDQPVPLDEIREMVETELTDKGIPIEFDLAITENDTIRKLTERADSLALANSKYKTSLFPHAIFDRNSNLLIHFPGQDRFIYRSVSWLLAASLLFSLIMLLTFSLSILFMLKQKKISEMKSDFINNMTHEFKTPLATISVAADSIVNEKVITQPERINYFVGMIRKENIRMNRQIEDILTIARLDNKDFEFSWEPVNVHLVIEDVVHSILLQVEARGGELSSRLNAVNPTVTTDKNHCANIIYNLLDNANKYSPDKPQITIETKNTGHGILISVRDKGIGMTKAVQSKIFERFYRQASGNIHNVKGFGLGLSYVKAVVEANQGTIAVHSEAGKGSRFDVFLPFLRHS